MVGSGIFLLPASLAIYGGISLFGWGFAAIGALILAKVFGDLSKHVSQEAGGPYVYTKKGLGEFPAFLVAWGYWISIWSTNAAIAVALVGYLSVFFPTLETNPMSAILTGLSFIWFFSWLNTQKIKTVGLVQLLTTVMKIIPIIALGFIGIFFVKYANFTPLNLTTGSDWSAITATTTLCFFAFLGMESATIPGNKVRDAKRNISRATIYGTLLTAIIYILGSAAVMGILSAEVLSVSVAPFADAAEEIWGDTGKYLVAIGAIISTMGALNGWLLIQGQIPMAAAKDQLFPKIFKKENKNGAPAIGIILSSLLVSGLMMINYSESLVSAFSFMMTLSTLSVVLPYIFSAASLVIFLKSKKNNALNILFAFLAFLFSIWIIIGCGQTVVFYGFILLLLGIPFYVYLKISKH